MAINPIPSFTKLPLCRQLTLISIIAEMPATQPTYTTAQPTLSDFTYVCVQPMAQQLPVDPTQLTYSQQCQPYYYSVEAADFYGSEYQPNYVSTTTNNLIAATANQSPTTNSLNVASYEPQIDIVSTPAPNTPHPNEFNNYKNATSVVETSPTPVTSSDYSSPGCSTSPSSTASLSSSISASAAASLLPPEIAAKVFCPPSALNPSGHQRTPRRNKYELNAKRVHYCTEPG